MGLHSAVDVGGRRGAREAHDDLAMGPQPEPPERDLEGCGAVDIADEAPAEAVGADVGSACPADPDGEVAHPAEVLDEGQRTGLDDLDVTSHRPTSTNRTALPGESRAGGSRSASQRTTSVAPMSCQPPGDARG